MTTDTTTALTAIINALKPLSSEERHRTVNAAMTFLGEASQSMRSERKPPADDVGDDAGEASYSPAITRWMKQNDISTEDLEHVFQLNGDGTFDILDVPGKSKREQTLNAYVLTGLGTLLTTGGKAFTDAAARRYCDDLGCYDQANHAAYLSGKGSELSGDKNRGFSLPTPGMKRAAVLVKEIAGAAK